MSREKIWVDTKTGEVLYNMKLNPNKYSFGNNKYIDSYSQFATALEEMTVQKGVNNYAIQRLDIRVDDYNNRFGDMYKINNIAVNILASALGIANCYKSQMGDVAHNIVARHSNKEIECYDRIAKDGEGLAKTRLEFRRMYPYSQLLAISDIPKVFEEWVSLLESKSLPELYKQFQAEQNSRILQAYNQGRHTRKDRMSVIYQNQDYICTPKQMGDLCTGLGLAKNVQYTYQNRLHIKYYKYAEIEEYLHNIANSMHIFFYLKSKLTV